jgi:hypothetical protein
MKFGFSEILIVGIITVLVLASARFFAAKNPPGPPAVPTRKLTATEARDEEILRNRHSSGKWISIVLVVVGVLLILGAPGLIKAFFFSYIGGFIAIALGIFLFLFLARRQQQP